MGFVAATPYILKSFIGPIGGITADILIKRKLLTVRGVRALFYGVGEIDVHFLSSNIANDNH